jgi:hypothetical protein
MGQSSSLATNRSFAQPGRFLLFFLMLRCGRHLSFRSDPFKKDAGGLVVRVLRHEFAPECLGEDGLVEMID